jgi:hypothetical protein
MIEPRRYGGEPADESIGEIEDEKEIDSTQLAESLNKVINLITMTDSRNSYHKQEVSKNVFNTQECQQTFSQFDLPNFGLDPDAPLFVGHGYGPGGLPLNIYQCNSRRDHLISDTVGLHRAHSSDTIHYVGVDIFSTDFDTLSMRRMLDGTRAQSMGVINMHHVRNILSDTNNSPNLSQPFT